MGSRPHRLVFAVCTCPSCLWGSSPTPGDVPLPSWRGARAPTSPTEPPGAHLVLLDLRPENVEFLQPQLPAAIGLPAVKEHSHSASVRAPRHPAGTAPAACFRGAPAEAPCCSWARAASTGRRGDTRRLLADSGRVSRPCVEQLHRSGREPTRPPPPRQLRPIPPRMQRGRWAGGPANRGKPPPEKRVPSETGRRGEHFPQPLRKPARAARAQQGVSHSPEQDGRGLCGTEGYVQHVHHDFAGLDAEAI